MYTTKEDGIDFIYWQAQLNNAIMTFKKLIQALTNEGFLNQWHSEWMNSAEKNTEDLLENQKTLLVIDESFDEQEFRKMSSEGMETAFWENINNYGTTLVNLGLVKQCSIFEQALLDTLYRIFINRQEIFQGLVKSEMIEVQDAIRFERREELITHLIKKKLKSISREGIIGKMNYFEDKFDISIAQIFTSPVFSSDDTSIATPANMEHLKSIFDHRHAIVHDLERPVKDYDELLGYCHFLDKVLSQLQFRVFEKFKFKAYVLGVDFSEKMK